MFLSGIKKNSVYPCKSQFYHIKVGLRGSKLYILKGKKKRRVNFIPKFHSSLKKFVKYFTMITKRYMYGTKVPNFIGL